MAIMLAVWRGDLRLKREVEVPEKRIKELEVSNLELATELKEVTVAAQHALLEEQAATRQEMAELRKTNAQLVKTLTTAGGLTAS